MRLSYRNCVSLCFCVIFWITIRFFGIFILFHQFMIFDIVIIENINCAINLEKSIFCCFCWKNFFFIGEGQDGKYLASKFKMSETKNQNFTTEQKERKKKPHTRSMSIWFRFYSAAMKFVSIEIDNGVDIMLKQTPLRPIKYE